MTSFPDHFSAVAAAYARYRPGYPPALFDWIASVAPARDVAWDCACGSGQATLSLADRFDLIVGTDASRQQLLQAPMHPRITWCAATAEASPLAAASVAAVTVGQALHWFDRPRFWDEVRRVTCRDGVIVAWSYGIPFLEEAPIARALRRFHDEIVGPYWPIERGHVDAGYRTMEFPFSRLEPPAMDLGAQWTVEQLAGYLRSWSATRRYFEATDVDPVERFAGELAPIWGPGVREIVWPLTVLAGRR